MENGDELVVVLCTPCVRADGSSGRILGRLQLR